MNINIYSREAIEAIIANGRFPDNTAVISFYDPAIKQIDKDYTHVDYSRVCDTVFYSELEDLDRDRLVSGEGRDDAGTDLASVPGLGISHVFLSWLYSLAAALAAAI